MYCSKCGANNQDGARFCNACGAAFPGPVGGGGASPSPLVVTIVVALLVTVIAGTAGFVIANNRQKAAATAQVAAQARQAQDGAIPPPAAPQPAPVSATDPVAEAQVVLEKYLAADLGHDGAEMQKYLGGQAAARFEPSVQGQEDLTVHGQQVSGHTLKNDNTILFTVEVKWASEGSSEEHTQTDSYTLKRTDEGWKITSTPAYPD